MQAWLETLYSLIPSGGALAFAVFVLLIMNAITRRRSKDSKSNAAFTIQVLRIVLVLFSLVLIILLAPLSEHTQGQVLSLLGVVLSAMIALSSTTFVSNMMAGLMLQASNAIRPGDFIRVDQQFGRVIRRNLLQTQIQTEWRDLTTLPNLLLINNPVTVLHRDGTIISAEISLGYDIPYTRIEELLTMAAAEAGLEDPFVLTADLLDHAVLYRVAGFLPDTKNLLTARSNLRKKAIEVLHGHGVEIVSPNFMSTRVLSPDTRVIPEQPVRHQRDRPSEPKAAPEERIFDKAEEAATLEQLNQELATIKDELKLLREEAKNSTDSELASANARIERCKERQAWLEAMIEKSSED